MAGFGNVSLNDVTVPAAALQLLQQAGLVGDPLYRYNELDQRWAAWDNWTFSLEFEPPPELLALPAILLHCDGIDTVADIELNGALVARTTNAHRTYDVDVTGVLTNGTNQLRITIYSAPLYAAQQAAVYPYAVPATQQLGSIPGYNFIRKAASDFGWDWGPAFAPAAISAAVELVGRSTAALTGMMLRQQHFGNGSVALLVDALLRPPPPRTGAGQSSPSSSSSPSPNGPAASSSTQAQADSALEQGYLLLEVTSSDGKQRWRAEVAVSFPPAPTRGCAASGGLAGSSTSSASGAGTATGTGGSDCASGAAATAASPWPTAAGCSSCSGGAGAGTDGAQEGGSYGSGGGAAADVLAGLPPMGLVKRSLGVLLEAPDLWWPHDMGQQPLYNVRLTYAPAASSSSSGGGNGSGSSSGSAPGSSAPVPEAEGVVSATEAVSGDVSRTAKGSGGPGGGTGSGAPAGGATNGGSQAAQSSAQSNVITRRVGIRLVELVTSPLPGSTGETFYFRVNGQPLYARGANIVPAHIHETAVTDAQLRRLVADVKSAHMNMLRVWGGGRYFKDAFYDACDAAGVLVWQEAMFACSMYPRDDAFLIEVWAEVTQQVARLSSHPSVAIWGGNNENEAAFNWFLPSRLNPQLYASDYSKLFVDVVREAVMSVDISVPFVDTSPSNGLLSQRPYAKRWGDVTDPRFGDVHFYDYNADALDPATYPPAKFVSEFGFMSLPSLAAYKRVTAAEDWRLGAPMADFRMRHARGLEELQDQLQRHFLPPPPSLFPQRQAQQAQQADVQAASQQQRQRQHSLPRDDHLLQLAKQLAREGAFEHAAAGGEGPPAATAAPAEPASNASPASDGSSSGAPQPEGLAAAQGQLAGGDQAQEQEQKQEERQFAAYTYLTQLHQALAYQTAVHQWRRNKADPEARTMGVLYWQLNDIWQGPSWSSINSDGSWRLLHHFATEFFRPVLVSGVRTRNGGVQVHLTNDLPVGVAGTLDVDIIPFAASEPHDVVPLYGAAHARIAPYGSRLAWAASIDADILPAAGRVPARFSNVTGGSRPAEAADVFLRVRFCPTEVQQGAAAAPGEGAVGQPPTLFGPAAAAAANGGSLAQRLQLVLGGNSSISGRDSGSSSSADERQAAASDGGGGGGATAPCDAPVQLAAGATEAQCAAARRLLQCSESLVFLTELKDARLAPANVRADVAHTSAAAATDAAPRAAGAAGGDDGELGASCGPPLTLAVSLRSDAVALFVSVETERVAGRFNGSGTLLLLPWQDQTLEFYPTDVALPADPHCSEQQGAAPVNTRVPVVLAAAGQPVVAPAAETVSLGAVPVAGVSVYWLQQALTDVQPPSSAPVGEASTTAAIAGAAAARACNAHCTWPFLVVFGACILLFV